MIGTFLCRYIIDWMVHIEQEKRVAQVGKRPLRKWPRAPVSGSIVNHAIIASYPIPEQINSFMVAAYGVTASAMCGGGMREKGCVRV